MMSITLSDARVGIAGLGGIGSNLAVMLARAGIGTLVLADFDVVDGTNIARQAYTRPDIGRTKVSALADIIVSIYPGIALEVHEVRVTPDNAIALFSGCDIVCEAFDLADQKAMLIETVLSGMDDTVMVGCSGMAGNGPANDIVTRRMMTRLYVCGDGTSDVSDGIRLNPARVSVCAGHMANAIIRILAGEGP